jgi:hypothetical protein
MLSYPAPERCLLEHRAFDALGAISFRRSPTDGTPIMAVSLGEREASIPLDSLRRAFAIADNSADGRMLDLIGTALDFVATLQPGDRLPAEIRTGEASWRPRADDLSLVTARLHLRFVAWMTPGSRWAAHQDSDADLLRMAADPALRDVARTLAVAAVRRVGLPETTDVMAILDDLAREMSYIEALRHRLLGRVETLVRKLAKLAHYRESGTLRGETLAQVQRLNAFAYRQIRSRFDAVDAQAGDMTAALRDLERQRLVIRTDRDWLYRHQRAWDPILKQWDGAGDRLDDLVCALLVKTYQFLAPRFMPTTEWQMRTDAPRPSPAWPGDAATPAATIAAGHQGDARR